MKLTATLTTETRANLEKASAQIARVLDEREKQTQGLESLITQAEEWLAKAREANAKADQGDATASAQYVAALDQSDRLKRKIAERARHLAEHLPELADAANMGREAIRTVLAQLAEENLEELANLLAPYCNHRAEAVEQANGTIGIQQLAFYRRRPSKGFEFGNEERALAVLTSHSAAISSLLKGKPIIINNPENVGLDFPAFIDG